MRLVLGTLALAYASALVQASCVSENNPLSNPSYSIKVVV